MTKTRLAAVIASVLAAASLPMPVLATTMPTAEVDAGRHHVAIGLSPAAAVDFAITNQFSLGGSVGLRYLYRGGRVAPPVADIRGVYQFVEGANRGVSVSGILGVTGDTSQPVLTSAWGVEVGIGLSYPFTPVITGRANLVALVGGGFADVRNLLGAPAAGLELAWRAAPNMELALAFNGYGDVLGLRFTF
jgi:hypothetical protein